MHRLRLIFAHLVGVALKERKPPRNFPANANVRIHLHNFLILHFAISGGASLANEVRMWWVHESVSSWVLGTGYWVLGYGSSAPAVPGVALLVES